MFAGNSYCSFAEADDLMRFARFSYNAIIADAQCNLLVKDYRLDSQTYILTFIALQHL